jgi:hypothetical protein
MIEAVDLITEDFAEKPLVSGVRFDIHCVHCHRWWPVSLSSAQVSGIG